MARRRTLLPAAEPVEPQAIRRLAKVGRTAVMRADWAEPEDRAVQARSASLVHGWRTYCPLRKMLGNPASGVTAAHVHAADKFRELVDAAMIGFSAGTDFGGAVSAAVQPRSGPPAAELARAGAAREVSRVMRRFMPTQRVMLVAIVVENRSLHGWSRALAEATGRPCDPKVEKGRLLTILDQLERHFASEVSFELDAGARMAP